MEVHIQEVAALLEGRIEGECKEALTGFAGIEEAGSGHLTFLSNPSYEPFLYETVASAVLISEELELSRPVQQGTALIRVADPYAAMAKLMQAFHPASNSDSSSSQIHPSAVVHDSASLGAGVRIGPLCHVGQGTVVGDGTCLEAGSLLADNVTIGARCRIGMRSIVGHDCRIGHDCTLQAGVVIGADGFGFAPTTEGYEKVPQIGNVILGDGCEIGAGTTIDRATLGSTLLGKGVKLDNLIQVAHNVTIGDHTVIAAQTGIAGSTNIGSGCMIGGQVGINGHIQIADGTKVAAKSGITASVTRENQTLQGNPAVPIQQHRRVQVILRQLVREFQSRTSSTPGNPTVPQRD